MTWSIFRRPLGLAGWCIWATVTAHAATQGPATPELQPIRNFTRPPAIESVTPSPSGQRLALLVYGDNGLKQLAVMELDPIGPQRLIAGFTDADITSVHWVNENRLVFEAYQRGYEVAQGGGGTFAVNHDGTLQRQLISWRDWTDRQTGSNIVSRVLPYGWYLASTVDDGSNDVLVYRRVRDAVGDLEQISFARVDTINRTLNNLSLGMPAGAREWLLDHKGEPRVITAYRQGRNFVYWRHSGEWQLITEFDPLRAGLTPWSIDDHDELIVVARSGSDVESLHRFDLVDKRIDPEPLVRVAGFDLLPAAETDSATGRLVGIHFRADRRMSVWFDQAIAAVQKGIDAALPDRSNRLQCGRCESSRFFVVRSMSDRQPGEYYLFDRKESALRRIGASRPWIDEKTQGRRSLHRVTVRDGLSMPVYVTRPVDAKPDQPLPAVVLVHGGPWVRGFDLGWDGQAQFLASRGYVVIEPEFRGSEGYGFKHFRAGWKQWGLAIQDDLVDAVSWAAKSKLVDPSRVCIAGASFGGYSALMGPIVHPGVYRCAASYAGVTDIGLMYTIAWSDTSQAARQYSMPVLIGDPATEARQLEAQSPLQRVAELKIPVLLAHGGLDKRVPIEHAERFVKAARNAGVDIEYATYPTEGHGWYDTANQEDFYARLERFLAKALKTDK
jgi:dipeptidyl aminopeptidase/acylaminoacyl peptidase